MSNKYKTSSGVILFVVIFLLSCKKFISIDPPVNQLTGVSVYNQDATAASVLTGLYANLSSGSFATGINSISVKAGLSADELTLWNGSTNSSLIPFYKNNLGSQSYLTFWERMYNHINTVNSVIEGVSNSTKLTPSVKKQIEGEAKFMRGFIYFYLVNFYGDVPVILTSDYRINAIASRTPKAEVYQQIISDLKEAQELLTSGYVGPNAQSVSSERVRPNKWSATAMLARTYLFIEDWANAEAQASAIISNTSTYDTVTITNSSSNVFSKSSKEAIWQLQPVNTGSNTEDARVFNITFGFNDFLNPVFLSSNFINAFEPSDERKSNWIKSYTDPSGIYSYAYKYKVFASNLPVTEYLTVLRLAEQYLVRAEARVQLNNFSGALSDLNIIRKRARLISIDYSDKSSLLDAILHERQVELFTEWGHRWLDLKRTNQINDVMNKIVQQKGGEWKATDQLYPLPLYDLQRNSRLIQNEGY